MKMTTCLDHPTLRLLLDQELAAGETQVCESHLENCPRCRQRLEELAGEPQWWHETVSVLSEEPQTYASDGVSAGWLGNSSPMSDFNAKTLMLSQVRQLLDAPGHPEMLGRLAGYDIESLLGQGGFGVVFRAFDRELNRPVAIKVLAPHLATVGTARRRFVREAQAAAAVTHPNVVPIHAVCTEAPYPFLVMGYVPGRSIQEQVRQAGPLEPKAVARIGQQVAAGLAAAHRQGLVHRDIKPANILLENGLDRALITDFGLARAADDAITQTGWLAGTPHYMSPEQAASGELDGRSDLFSLGSVLYFMATGREPFRGTQPLAIMNQIANQKPPSVRAVNSDVPQVLAQVIERLLEKKPADRFQTAAELSDFLEQYLAYLHQPEMRTQPKVPRKRRTWLLYSLAVGWSVMLMLAVGIMYGVSVWSVGQQSSESAVLPIESLPRSATSRSSTSAPTPVTFESIQQAMSDWDQDHAAMTRDLSRLKDEIAATGQYWQGDAERQLVDLSHGFVMPDLSKQFQDLQQAIRTVELGVSAEEAGTSTEPIN